MNEEWKDIDNYKGLYQISNLGRVRSLSRFQSQTERFLKGEIDNRGYIRVRLSFENRTQKFQVHRLVALGFISNPQNKPQVNHIDGNRSNNVYVNLEWCTGSENMIHAFKTGLQSLIGEKNNQSKLTELEVKEVRRLLSAGAYHKDIALKYNVSRSCITDINRKKTWCNVI